MSVLGAVACDDDSCVAAWALSFARSCGARPLSGSFGGIFRLVRVRFLRFLGEEVSGGLFLRTGRAGAWWGDMSSGFSGDGKPAGAAVLSTARSFLLQVEGKAGISRDGRATPSAWSRVVTSAFDVFFLCERG